MKTWADFGIDVRPGATGNYATTCPQCSPHRKNAKAKCLSANIEDEVWNCHHCSWSGTLKQGIDRKSNPWEFVPKTYKKPTFKHTPPKDTTIAWFEKRGIPANVVQRNQISAAKVWMPQVEAEVDCIQFPVIRKGEVVNIKSRDAQKNFKQESGAERVLYGMDDVTGDTMIIVEGEIDKLSVEVAGFLNCVSVPDGAPSPTTKNYASKFEFLENCEEFLKGIKKVILAVDNDEPGKVLEEELARRLGREKCERTVWPEGCKDANEVLVKCGRDKLRECIKMARPYPLVGIFEVTDIYSDIQTLYRNGLQKGALPGWPSVNELYSVRTGEWSLVTGIPGSGKSEWLDAMLVNLARDEGWKFALFSPENSPLQRHFAKLAEKFIGKPFSEHRYVERMKPHELEKACKWVHRHFIFLNPPDDELTVEAVIDKARSAVLRHGINGIVIDPWNELDHSRPPGLSETEYISQCLTRIRRFARECNLHVWLVAHPTKLQKDKVTGTYPVPTPYDVSGSSHWRNKADYCIAVHRELKEGNKEVEVHIQKVRFKEIGKVGVAVLEYKSASGRYTDQGMNEEELPYEDDSDECPY
jgi:twinkle protein